MGEREGNSLYSCTTCRNPLALTADLLSKSYKAKSGQAYLFSSRWAEGGERINNSIAKIFCSRCGQEMGWTYVRAFDALQKYKEGKYIIERAKIFKQY